MGRPKFYLVFLWFRYQIWRRHNASPPCIINMKILLDVWTSIKFKREKCSLRFLVLFSFLYNKTLIQNSFVQCTSTGSTKEKKSKKSNRNGKKNGKSRTGKESFLFKNCHLPSERHHRDPRVTKASSKDLYGNSLI